MYTNLSAIHDENTDVPYLKHEIIINITGLHDIDSDFQDDTIGKILKDNLFNYFIII